VKLALAETSGPLRRVVEPLLLELMTPESCCQEGMATLSGLMPPPELAARFAHATIANPDSTYAAALFQTGWFVESLLTQTLIIHVIRTNKIPFIQSRASWQLIMTSSAIMLVGMWLPSSPIGGWLGLVPLPFNYWPLLLLTLLAYVGLTQMVKVWLVRKKWI